MVRTVESGSQARAPHGHCIRAQNPAARDATLSRMVKIFELAFLLEVMPLP